MAVVTDTIRTNSKAISHKYVWTSSVLYLRHFTKNLGCVFSTWIAFWDHVWLTYTGLQSENTETVSPQTALKVILSRPQPNTVTVQSCMCEMKYIHLLAVHGPSIIAQSAWKQFRFLPHRLSWKGTLTEYSTFKNQPYMCELGYEALQTICEHGWHGLAISSSAFSGYHMDSWYRGVTHAVQSCTCELPWDHTVEVQSEFSMVCLN